MLTVFDPWRTAFNALHGAGSVGACTDVATVPSAGAQEDVCTRVDHGATVMALLRRNSVWRLTVHALQRRALALLRCASRRRWPWLEELPQNRFYVRWRPHEAAPDAAAACTIAAPTMLRPPKRTKSFGHLLRDNFASLRYVAEQLGADVASLTWLQAPTSVGAPALANRLVHKYAPWGFSGKVLEWHELLAQCQQGAAGPLTLASLAWCALPVAGTH